MKQILPEQIDFNTMVDVYVGSSVICSYAAEILVERLMCWKSLPYQVLDLGAGTGQITELLLSLSQSMQVYALDIAEKMLAQVPNSSQVTKVLGNARSMPCHDNQFDAVLANMVLPWCANWPTLFAEIKRVLRPGGLLLLSTLSPHSWPNLHLLWSEQGCWRDLPEMEVVGDLLTKLGYCDTVMDKMMVSFAFEDEAYLAETLQQTGWLTQVPPLQDPLQKDVQFDLELVFGHAIKPMHAKDEFLVDPRQISHRR